MNKKDKKQGLYIGKFYYSKSNERLLKVGLKIGYTANLETRVKYLKQDGVKLLCFFPCKYAKIREYELKTDEIGSWLASEHFRYTKSEYLFDEYNFKDVYNLVSQYANKKYTETKEKVYIDKNNGFQNVTVLVDEDGNKIYLTK